MGRLSEFCRGDYVRRDLYMRHALFDTSFRIAADYDFVLRLLGREDIRSAVSP